MDGDENDVEITMEKLEAEAKEVRQQLSHGGANNLTRATLNSPPQGHCHQIRPLLRDRLINSDMIDDSRASCSTSLPF